MTLRFDVDLGLKTLKGVLTLGADHLQVEWRVYDMFEAPVGSLETLSIPFSELTSIAIHRRILKPVVEIVANTASTFGTMPLPAGDLATLRAKVTRVDRNKAFAWQAEAVLRLAQSMTDGFLED